jgi:hypothetical protein
VLPQDRVAFYEYVARLLEADPHRGRSVAVADPVAAQLDAIAVHQEDADHVFEVVIAFHAVRFGVHEVQRIAGSRHGVARYYVVG